MIKNIELSKKLYYLRKTRWDKGTAVLLPEEYKKFWYEWKTQPSAIHYIEQKGKYIQNEKTEEVSPVQNIPIPLLKCEEMNEGLWGGESIIQGFKKKGKFKRKVAHFWFPHLMRSVVYSEVLDSYMRVVMTYRLINLIHENYGFDHYLLKTPACDLNSLLGVKLKRQILIALADKTLYPDDSKKRDEVYAKYEQYLSAYTREEIEWYGLTFKEACIKYALLTATTLQPLKIQYRSELIAKLKENKIEEAENVDVESPVKTDSSWVSKINPFSKSPKHN